MIEFSEATHTYKFLGVILPSVTQIMTEIGLIKPYTGDPWYGERGSAIHAATELIDAGTLDWDTVDGRIEGYLTAYHKFKDEQPFSDWDHSEVAMVHPTYRYAGRPDRFLPLVDIKSGAGDVIQLAAYGELLRANGFDPGREAFMLKLNENGTYKLTSYKFNRKDTSIWLSAVSLWHYRKEKGLV